jgi:hypothetical protein
MNTETPWMSRDDRHMIWAHRLALLDIAMHSPGVHRIDPYEIHALAHEIKRANGDWNKIVEELLGIIRCLVWSAHTHGDVCDTAAAVQHVQDMLDNELARIEYDP